MGFHLNCGRALRCLLAAAVAAGAPAAAEQGPSIAVFYGRHAPLEDLRAFDIAVVEPGYGYDPVKFRTTASELFAYVSVGEVHALRPYVAAIPENWRIGHNADWGSFIIDQSQPEWPAFFAEKVVAPLWEAGYRGLFLDTLDSFRRAERKVEEAEQLAGMVRVIKTLRARFPGIRLIVNRSFELLPQVAGDLTAVAAESLYRTWDPRSRRYSEVTPQQRAWLMHRLVEVRDRLRLPVLVIDYVPESERALARQTAERIRAQGFIPWVSQGHLDSMGVGAVEVMPRRVLVVYNGEEAPDINYSDPHRFIDTPLNYLGYIPEYLDVGRPLPEKLTPGRYAGVVVWLTGGLNDGRSLLLSRWLRRHIDSGLRVAVLGEMSFVPDAAEARHFGLDLNVPQPRGRVRVTHQDRMLGFEAPPRPDRWAVDAVRLVEGEGVRPLLQVTDEAGNRYDAAALTPWGGFVLNPYAVSWVPGLDQTRWVLNPFDFLTQALNLPAMPVPDFTTENGRRLFFVHIDGDGFASMSEAQPNALAPEVLLKEVLEKYRVPTTFGVIEAELSGPTVAPELRSRMESVARRIFALPHVEPSSHTYSHPFSWAKAEANQDAYDPGAYFALEVPGYRVSLSREIVGSTNYVRQQLAPPDKPVRILQWSGDAVPGPAALKVAYQAGLLNINGGGTVATRSDPSLTRIAPLGVEKGGMFQIYAPVTNENLYTNLWQGPFYGFERVTETFEFAETPRRLKPIDIYYHAYSATRRASLEALRRVYAYALERPTHPIHAAEFIRKALDFNGMVVARGPNGWVVRGDGQLRTLRVPDSLGAPDVAASSGVAGFSRAPEGGYLHLAGDAADIRFAAKSPPAPYLASANARLESWTRAANGVEFSLRGHVPLELALGNTQGCTVADGAGRALKPALAAAGPPRGGMEPPRGTAKRGGGFPAAGGLTHISLPHAAGTFKVICRAG